MCGRAKCGQLNLAHLTETARYRYICYSSVDHSSGVLVGLVHSLSSVKRTVKALLKRRQCPASQDIFVVVTRRRGHATFKRIITVRTTKSPVKASSWRNYHCPSTRIHSNIRRVRRSQASQTLLRESQIITVSYVIKDSELTLYNYSSSSSSVSSTVWVKKIPPKGSWHFSFSSQTVENF